MSLQFLPKIKRKSAALVLAAGLFVCLSAEASSGVQTYTNQALSSGQSADASYGTPIPAGKMTLDDVLETHPLPKKPTLSAPSLATPANSTVAPTLQAPSQASPESDMLLQGMKSVLQASSSDSSALQAPRLPGAPLQGQAAETAEATGAPIASSPFTPAVAPSQASLPNGIQYQPGQAPKDLATNGPLNVTPGSAGPSANQSQAFVQGQDAQTPDMTATDVAAAPGSTVGLPPTQQGGPQSGGSPAQDASADGVATANCTPHTEKWVKTCAEAGYPETFTGQIQGETHTGCPAGTLQDVWVANSCAAPDMSDSTAALSAPNAPQAMVTSNSSATPDVLPAAGVDGASSATLSSGAAGGMTAAPGTVTDGACGAANGLAVNLRPAQDLCLSGQVTDVSGDGPWRWDCRGIGSGMTVSCAASIDLTPPPPAVPAPQISAQNVAQAAPASNAPSTNAQTDAEDAAVAQMAAPAATPADATPQQVLEDGQCGPSADVGTDHAPADGLCTKGIMSRVSGQGPWTWACSGRNGGQAVACTAPKVTEGICGSASGIGTNAMPMENLCNAGYASAITGNGPWNWTCSGLYGGAPALCSAVPKQDAVCGTASLYGHREAPRDNLCSIGQASNVNGGGPWSWTCNGANGGAPVACQSQISVGGSCGSANGVGATSRPSDNLCSHGKASRVTGEGPWLWNCSGTDGGESQSCAAPVGHPAVAAAASGSSTSSDAASSGSSAPSSSPLAATPSSASTGDGFVACGPAADFAAFSTPTKDLCAKGEASTVSGDGPWTWVCSDTDSHKTECSTLQPSGSFSEAMASNAAASQPPAAKAQGSEMPAPMASPTAAVSVAEEKPACGSASGQGTQTAPTEYLCSAGKASALHGDGPWTWTCAKGKGKASCEAPKLQDASCGGASGSMQRTTPSSNLCHAGAATAVQGTGPWMWSCVGTGGGVSVSCSAASQTQTRLDGTCGPAATEITQTAPTVNLCDGGMPSIVHGSGPWTWTCSGLNGGVASLCSAQKNLPPAPPAPGPQVNGLCGNANGAAAVMQPDEGLCTSGSVTQISGNGPWNWNCLGSNGGMTVSCTAPLQPPTPIVGMCGSATGVPTLTTPKGGLCAAGISSAVNGRGPWTWSCSGTNGGGAVACVAPYAGGAGTGIPSLVTPSEAPLSEAPTPQPSRMMPVTSAGLQTPHLPANGTLPPLAPGAEEHLIPSSPFPQAPEPSAMPPVPAPEPALQTPQMTPDIPEGTQVLQPPAVRDTIKSAPALSGVSKMIPGNHVVLPDDLSVIPFKPLAENIDTSALPMLDKLVLVLQSNPAEHITLTSYASTSSDTSPRDARRLSLTRALAVRDYLTAKGVSSARINVRALGVNVPSGDPDRVDIAAE